MSDRGSGSETEKKRVRRRRGRQKPRRRDIATEIRHSIDEAKLPVPVASKSNDVKNSWDDLEKNQEIRSYLSLARNIASSPVKYSSASGSRLTSPIRSPVIKPKASKGPLPYSEAVLASFPITSPHKLMPNGKSHSSPQPARHSVPNSGSKSSPHTPKLNPQPARHSAPNSGTKSAPYSANKLDRHTPFKLDKENIDLNAHSPPRNRTRSDTTGMEASELRTRMRRTASTPTPPASAVTESPLRHKSSPEKRSANFSKLHDEMIDVCCFFDRNRKERYERRIQVTKRISEMIYELWPQVEVSLIGSTATGLFLYDSDIDLVVRNPDKEEPLSVRDLIMLGRVLEESKTVRSIQVIATAMVPIIKMEDKYSPYTVDITFNVTTGLYSTVLVQDFVDKHESLKPLLLVLKQLLKVRGLNELYRGGLPSFTVTIMIVSFLQFFNDKSTIESEAKFAENFDHDYDAELRRFEHGLKTDLGSEDDEHSDDEHTAMMTDTTRTRKNYDFDLGQHLLGFLELYGCTFDYRQLGISIVNEGGYFPKKSRGWLYKHNPDLLCVEHPQDRNLDLGFKVYNIELIRSTFATIHGLLKTGTALGEILGLSAQTQT